MVTIRAWDIDCNSFRCRNRRPLQNDVEGPKRAPVERELFLYSGRVLMGWVVLNGKTDEVRAFAHGIAIGSFSTFKTAKDAIDLAYERAASPVVERAA
jgi:hypothetical protein